MDGSPEVGGEIDAVEVYWRPGCPFCGRLLRVLEDSSVRVRLHNIWDDDDARQFVRAHNDGDETVPTVAVGAAVKTNPEPVAFVAALRATHAHLVGTAS